VVLYPTSFHAQPLEKYVELRALAVLVLIFMLCAVRGDAQEERGIFDAMVGRRLKSLIFEHLAARPDLGGSHILSHILPFATVCYAFRAVSFWTQI
jgi:hypothetical protein